MLSTHQDANRSFDFEAYFELPEKTRDVRTDMPFKTKDGIFAHVTDGAC